MKRTKTASFGSGKRENHDSSEFYGRNLYGDRAFEQLFARELTERELKSIPSAPLGVWADRLYCRSSENMVAVPDNSVGLALTSPPYNVGKDYEDDLGLKAYLRMIEKVGREVHRVLRPGGRYVINVANLGRKPYIPMHALFYDVHLRIGFLPMGEIIWQKSDGAAGNVAWGSWQNAKAPRLRDIHEYLLVFAKQSYSRPDTGQTRIGPAEFMDSTLSIWRIPPESARRARHPAPFPLKLAERVIDLYSYVGDVVLDPFMGSGTTCAVAAYRERHYIGFEISRSYCEIAREKIRSKGRPYMATEKTETSELAVAFGILGVKNHTRLWTEDIAERFKGSLAPEKYERYKKEYRNPANNQLYRRLLAAGLRLRTKHTPFRNVRSLLWYGPEKQAKSSSVAQDLLVANTPISIKAESNVLSNPSPANIFRNIPQGKVMSERADNWFLLVAPREMQRLYTAVRSVRLHHFRRFPKTVLEFEKSADQRDRKELQNEIRKLRGDALDGFDARYQEMCRKVSRVSADSFNRYFGKAMGTPSRNAIIEHLIRHLFRMDSIEYVSMGIEKDKVYTVRVPSMTQWKKEWEFVEVQATPDLGRKQSRVILRLRYRNKISKVIYPAQFHVEIRWSHGKFCGAPEAKLYKDFNWSDIQFVTPIP